MEYAIVDIETTGGNASSSRMIEIAICIHDGNKVVDRFESLINPEQNIPLAIFALTGINNELVEDAPVFSDIARKVYGMLQGRIFVAHNVNFDYSFVRHQLEEAGFKWNARKLCTVRMARKIKPRLLSYSLGRLCDSLGIPLDNRHRAGGDCEATALLFGKLLQWDTEGVIPEMLKKASKDQRLPPNLPQEQFDELPERPGIYYFHDQSGKAIYVGKALNIKKRVARHFSGHNIHPQRQHFLREIHSVSSQICATELIALILECIEIKRLWPAYNRSLKRFEPKYGLLVYEDIAGYKRLAIGRLAKHQTCVQVFNRENDAVNQLRKLVDEYGIDIRYCSFGSRPRGQLTIGEYWNAPNRDEPLPTAEAHNKLVGAALENLEKSKPTFAIVDKGLDPDGKSFIWVENGRFYAMGHLDPSIQLSSPEEVRNNLKRYDGNHYIMQLITSFAERHPSKVWKMDQGSDKSRI